MQRGYRPLAAKAQLLVGVACEDSSSKVLNLTEAFQNACEMGLLELSAESASYLGIHYLESGNLIPAREYLLRSVSTADGLAEEIPVRLRAEPSVRLAEKQRRIKGGEVGRGVIVGPLKRRPCGVDHERAQSQKNQQRLNPP